MAWFRNILSAVRWFCLILLWLVRLISDFVPALGERVVLVLRTAEAAIRVRLMTKRGHDEISESFPQEPPRYSDDESDLEDKHGAEPVNEGPPSVGEVDNAPPACGKENGGSSDRFEFCRVKTSDEFYCEYDSTWETEECDEDPPHFTRRHYKFRRFENAAKDMQNYRHKYPNRSQSSNGTVTDTQPNLNFYLEKTPSLPDGAYISDFHDEWSGLYDKLESVHTYIQWLFPLPEPGLNYDATPLTRKEIEGFRSNKKAKENLLKSYKLMLDFYGIHLLDHTSGKVERARHWEDRFRNLNSRTHNNLRITRILKCLGILGFPHYQANLVRFFLNETLVHGELQNVRESALSYFVFAVLDKKERRKLIKFAYENYEHDDEFVWCPKSIQEMWSRQTQSDPQRGINGDDQSER